MQSYIYVDIDDEITTVIGKLKVEKESREVFLVVPKRALIAQSLVNLQLLDKEAKKIAKKLIFVSPDSHTRKIAEKAGLEVKKYVAKPEEPKKEEVAMPPVAVQRKMSPAEEAAAKDELNVIMGKVPPAVPSAPPVAAPMAPPQVQAGVSIRPSTFSSGSNLFAVKKNISPVNTVPSQSPTVMTVPSSPPPVQVPAELPKTEPPKQNISPIVDLRKSAESKREKIEKEIKSQEKPLNIPEGDNPFKVRSIIPEKPLAAPSTPIPSISPAPLISAPPVPQVKTSPQPAMVAPKSSPAPTNSDGRSFYQHEKELANLTLREKERLRDLWMENKGVVRGKFVQSSGNIDLRREKNDKIQAPKSFEENDGLIKTTRRIVSGSGKVVDLRSKKMSIGDNSASADLKKKDQKEILLPLVNVRFFSIFILGILVVLLIVGGIILPRADVSLISKNLASDFEMSFKINGETSEINLADKILPGSPVRFKLTQENIFSASGEKEVKEKSRGQVALSNSGASAVEIKKNTILIGEKGKKYSTLSPVTVPAATAAESSNQNLNDNVGATTASGEVYVEVTALDFGSDYDLKNGTELKLSDPLAGVAAQVSRTFTGGKNEKAKIVTEEDINRAKEELTARVKEKSVEEAKKYFDSANGEILFPHESGLEEISFSSSKDGGELGENFSAKLEISFFALTFSSADAKRLAEETVESDDKNRGGSISIKDFRVTNFNPLENQMEISANFQYKEKANVATDDLTKQLVAKSRKEGENFLSKNSEVESYSVKAFPSWLPWFPLLERNIQVKVD